MLHVFEETSDGRLKVGKSRGELVLSGRGSLELVEVVQKSIVLGSKLLEMGSARVFIVLQIA